MNEKKKGLILLTVVVFFVIVLIIGMIIDNSNKEKKLKEFIDYISSSETTLVVIGREGCSYCIAYTPEMEFMSQHFGFKYKYVNTTELGSSQIKKVLEKIEVSESEFGTPYTAVFKDGKKIDNLAGAVEESDLLSFLKKHNFVSNDEKLLINYLDYKGYESILNGSETSVIGIGKTTCIYCKMVKSTLNKVIKNYNVKINYLNIDLLSEEESESLFNSLDFFETENWGTPTFLIVKNGKLVDTIDGAQSEEVFVSRFKELGLIGD